MAAITQEKLDKAVNKAVVAERRRCVAAVKGLAVTVEDKAQAKAYKTAQRDAVAAINAVVAAA